MQRGGFSIAGPVQNPCYRKVGPCGSDTKGAVTTIAAGSAYTVEFQQNANHCAWRALCDRRAVCAAGSPGLGAGSVRCVFSLHRKPGKAGC